jgi:hypothetical protein
MSAYEEKVRRGVELLDSHPNAEGWRDKIDPDKLNLADSCGCVLGQTFGWFDDGIDALGLEYGESSLYGFMITDEGFYNRRRLAAQYGWLTRAWRKVLRNGN